MVDFKKALDEAKRRRESGELSFAEQMMKEQEEKDLKILSVIGSTEPSTFFDLCNGLRRLDICPEKGDKTGWGTLFRKLGEYEAEGLCKTVRKNKNIETIQLTQSGADKVRDFADSKRELFQVEDMAEDDNVPWEV